MLGQFTLQGSGGHAERVGVGGTHLLWRPHVLQARLTFAQTPLGHLFLKFVQANALRK